MDSGRAEVYANRCAAYSELGLWEEAVRDADEALKLQPSSVKSQYRKAVALDMLQCTEEALHAVEQALAHAPASKKLKQLRAQLCARMRTEFQSRRLEDVSLAQRCLQDAKLSRSSAEAEERRQAQRREEERRRRREQWELQWEDEIQRMAYRYQFPESRRGADATAAAAAETDTGDASLSAEEVLGVGPGAGAADIRRAYLAKAVSVHPDKGGSVQAFVQLQAAFKALMATCSPAP
eukprot:jgi/Tetstr1/445965/TSEL_033592.t1